MQHNIVHAFILSLAHRERVEASAIANSVGNTTEIRYASALEWPWPRQFTYTREFLSHGSSAECLQAIHSLMATTEEHVVNFFSGELDAEIPQFEPGGLWRPGEAGFSVVT